MFKKLLLTFFLLFSSFIIIYPSKKETTNLLDYCYSFEKLLARNSLEDNKESNKFNSFAKDVTFFGTNKTKGALVNKVIDQYKTSKRLFIINLVPNKFICLTGYWIEVVNPGLFKSMIYQKSKQKINQYKDIKKEVDEFIKDINLETIKKEMKDLF
jgi:hypothetical protein